MNLQTLAQSGAVKRMWIRRFFSVLTTLAMALGPLAPALPTPVAFAADCGSINIVARDAVTGLDILNFRWMINLDNSHDNTSILNPIASYSPVVATGNQDNATGISLPDTPTPTPPLPTDRGYLVTVLAYDGLDIGDPDYKIGGKHFSLPLDDAGGCDVVAELQPHFVDTGSGSVGNLPLATLHILVFHDNTPVNNAEDLPVEQGLEGFHITLHDRVGEVVTDWFGNPICTKYLDFPGGTPEPGTGGFCVTGPDGRVTIENMGPDKYAIEAIPPDGSAWIQTSTIEGKHEQDAWVAEGATGFATEGELFGQTITWMGFIRPCEFGLPNLADLEGPEEPGKDDCASPTADTVGTGTITGHVRAVALDAEVPVTVLGREVEFPYVALNNIGGDDEQVWMGRGDEHGFFTIGDVPAGIYQIVVWDEPLDYIITFLTVQVGVGETVPLGDIGIPDWFGRQRGFVYIDNGYAANGTFMGAGAVENGKRDCLGSATGPFDLLKCERGYPMQDLDTRAKDGSVESAAFSDRTGYYEFTEVFPKLAFIISEVGYGRFKNTGAASYQTNLEGDPLSYPDTPTNVDPGLAGLLQATINWAGLTNWIDWGKKAFGPGENGGIVGIVFNATTRNELNARLSANEDYEPGVPGVTVNLYKPVLNGSGQPVYDGTTGEVLKDHIANTYVSDDWYANLPTDCIKKDTFGRSAAAGEVAPDPEIWDQCLELFSLQNQMKSGVFDGGYAFDLDCSSAVSGNMNPANLKDPVVDGCPVIDDGWWVVEIVPPTGYEVLKEENINVFSGDVYVPQIPPPPCAGPLHEVDVKGVGSDGTGAVYNPDFAATTGPLAPLGGSPYEGQMMPLCDARLVRLQTGQNANSDFFIFTDVPIPGRIQGLLTDDLHNELDPTKPNYGDKRGIPNTPIGFRDFSGNLLQMVYTDDNGYFETILPSTGTYNCPLPAGPCPGMYFVVGNDPGDPDSPTNWNPNYGSLALTLDVWPGLTTLADVAILPITGFVATPGSQFETAFACNIPTGTPDLMEVSQPYGDDTGGPLTIMGTGFGGSGDITLSDGSTTTSVSYTSLDGATATVTLPAMAAGPYQLLVTTGGATSPTGITFHVLGVGYNPSQVHVDINDLTTDADDDGTSGNPFHSIEAALDDVDTDDGDLVLVHPGIYYESIIIDDELKLQGYGPGVTSIDGRFFGLAGAGPTAFDDKVALLAYDGPSAVPHGQTVTVLATVGEFDATDPARIDGFAIRGATRFNGEGAGIYAHAFAKHLQISNNLIQSNAGVHGGGIRLGLPYTANPDAGGALDAENDNVRIHHNRILNNGGILLAGGIAIFNGAENYEIDHDIICGNYSAEYGGGISNFGYSSGSIHDNAILFNNAFDEGGGIMIAGELLPQPGEISLGTGDVDILRNRLQGNVSNDDGGGIRLLQPVAGAVRIINNMIVNNLATDTGGGIALDDALDVHIINNTVARNLSTGTAEDAELGPCAVGAPAGAKCTVPHGAGLVSEAHSAALMAAYSPPSSFTDPVLFNNIFWQNQAYSLNGLAGLYGGGLPFGGYLDMEVLGGAGVFDTDHSFCTASSPNCLTGGTNTNLAGNPLFVAPVSLNFSALAFAGDPAFITVVIQTTPADPQGDYHLTATSPAIDAGTSTFGSVSAPTDDFNGDVRPMGDATDMGADETPGLLPPEADLSITKDDGVTTEVPGTAATDYTIIVSNAGPNGVNDAVVTDNFPAELSGVSWTCTASVGSNCDAASGSGDINATVDLLSGGSATFTAGGTIASSATGSLSNSASVAAPFGVYDPNPVNDSATDSDTLTPQADLGITKSDGATSVVPGSPVTYEIVVTNAGPSDAPGASVTDDFPATLAGVTWTCSGTGTCPASGSGDILGVSVNLPAGSSVTFSASGTLAISASGTLDNTASVAAPAGVTEVGPNPNSATDSDTILSAAVQLYFSTTDNVAVPGVAGPNDDSDIYSWNGLAFMRVFDASAFGVPGGADVDAMVYVDSDTVYVSFKNDNVALPGLPDVDDEDIARYDAGTWSLYFDGSDVGLTTGGEDVDAFEILSDGSVLISTLDDPLVPGLPTTAADRPRNEDLLRCTGTFGPATTCTWSMYFDGADVALTTGGENVDGAAVAASGNIYLTTEGNFAVAGPLAGQDEDVFVCNSPTTGPATACASFSLYFDGSAHGVTNDLDAIDLP